jgi:hypothetical protein
MGANVALTSRKPPCGSVSPARARLRIGVPDYFYNDDTPSGFANGFGDLSLGFKKQLGPTFGGFDISVIPAVSFDDRSRVLTLAVLSAASGRRIRTQDN